MVESTSAAEQPPSENQNPVEGADKPHDEKKPEGEHTEHKDTDP